MLLAIFLCFFVFFFNKLKEFLLTELSFFSIRVEKKEEKKTPENYPLSKKKQNSKKYAKNVLFFKKICPRALEKLPLFGFESQWPMAQKLP